MSWFFGQPKHSDETSSHPRCCMTVSDDEARHSTATSHLSRPKATAVGIDEWRRRRRGLAGLTFCRRWLGLDSVDRRQEPPGHAVHAERLHCAGRPPAGPPPPPARSHLRTVTNHRGCENACPDPPGQGVVHTVCKIGGTALWSWSLRVRTGGDHAQPLGVRHSSQLHGPGSRTWDAT